MEKLAEKLIYEIRKQANKTAHELQDGRWSWFEGRQYAELATESEAMKVLVEMCKEIWNDACYSFETASEKEANEADFRRKE